MADAPRPDSSQTVNTLMVIGIVVAVVFAAFFFLSSNYYSGKLHAPHDLADARIAFAVACGIVGLLSFAASEQPRLVGHGLALGAGVAALIGGVESLGHGMPPVLGITLTMIGALLPILAWMSYDKRSRVAWSFLSSLVIVFALVTFFGAPKVRNMLHIGLWYAMIIPGVLTVCAVALSLVRFEYREQLRR